MQSILIDTAAVGRGGVWVDRIDGRYCKITVHQLAMAWWCYQAGHITRRQLRVWFAAHEMRERRRYTKDATRKPLYGLDEIKALVGGRGSKKADLALAADIRALARLGLVGITDHAIQFAVSIDQIAVDDVPLASGRSSTTSPTDHAASLCRGVRAVRWPRASPRP